MSPPRHYERHFTALKILYSLLHASTFGLLLVSCPTSVHATPVRREDDYLIKRQQTRRQNVLPPTIWIPFVVLTVLSVIVCFVRILLQDRRQSNGIGGRPTELTANQIINGDAEAGINATRRPRRLRRTPSQMSITSLPEYNKEPGAEEVVIFRGQKPSATSESIVVDHYSDEEREDGNSRRSERYSLRPTSPTTVLLLQDEGRNDIGGSNSTGTSVQLNPSQQSFGTRNTPNDTNSLIRLNSNTSEPAGPSPAYFEVVSDDLAAQAQRVYPPPSLTSSTLPAGSPPSSPTRSASGFRTLLNRMSMPGHQRGDSVVSVTSSSGGSGTSMPQLQHRPSPSASSFVLFRPLTKSSHVVNSTTNLSLNPSMISLNSISAPLTHTAMRTEFAYPKTGPTPDQLKIIASRESIGKFSVPYGPDAIAFAASTSMHELLPPPPEFETAVIIESVEELQDPARSSTEAGPSGLHSSRATVDAVEEAASSEVSLLSETGNTRERTLSSPSSVPVLLVAKLPDGIPSTFTGNDNSLSNDVPSSSMTTTTTTPVQHTASSASSSSSKPEPLSKIPPPPPPPLLSQFGQTLAPPNNLLAPPSSFQKDSILRSNSVSSIYSNNTYVTAVDFV